MQKHCTRINIFPIVKKEEFVSIVFYFQSFETIVDCWYNKWYIIILGCGDTADKSLSYIHKLTIYRNSSVSNK